MNGIRDNSLVVRVGLSEGGACVGCQFGLRHRQIAGNTLKPPSTKLDRKGANGPS